MNESYVVSAFALIACVTSFVTWLVILYGEIRAECKSFWILMYAFLGVFLSAWFGVGFALILLELPLQTSTYFRPLFPIVLMLYTGGGVLVHRSRLNQQTIIRQKEVIRGLMEKQKKIDELEKRNGL